MDQHSKSRLEQRTPCRSLKHRLRHALVGLGISIALLGTLGYGISDSWQRRRTLVNESESLSRAMAAQLARTGLNFSWALELPFHEKIESAFIFDADGKMHSRYDLESGPNTSKNAQIPTSSWGKSVTTTPILTANGSLGNLHLVTNITPGAGQLWTYLFAFASATLAAFVLSSGIAKRLHRRISSSLLDLTHTANAISARQDYSIRALVRSNDEIGLLVEIFNHMIEQVQLREQRLSRAVKRAEEAQLAKSQFLATMSHEIRTPINGIMGMTQLLWDTKLSSDQLDFAKTIDQSARGLLKIINDILEFSKGEAKRYSLEQIPFSLQDVIKDCLATTATMACEKNLELSGFAAANVPSTLRGDPSRLRQVLLNLISNALKFTHKGHIQVSARLLEDHGSSISLAIEVSDTGIGIPEDRIDRLYKCFSQVDSSNHRKFGGTGLGLAISRQIIHAMDGEMTLKTKEGVGSTFGFKLRLPKESEQIIPSAPKPEGMRILAIESSTGIQESLSEILEGNQVEFCSTGIEGRKLLLDAKPEDLDLVILDERLTQDMGVSERDHELPFPPVPMIVVTPITHNASQHTLNWPGKLAHMAKPLNPSDLFWCVSSLCNNSSSATPAPREASPAKKSKQLPFMINVLVVEDHPVNQRITMRFLEKIGARYSIANNGQEAVAAFETGIFDMILMDVQMPVMDGIEATRAIREFELTGNSRIPIIAMTASVLEVDEEEREIAGFDDFVPKPVSLNDLNDCLRRWMQSRIHGASLVA